ncbi:MAG: LacI family DNA-binding transcriptional regulator [Erysipelotrichaceae bacterium]|nr:LacI family DNA-binding transcriptional regulator [Erysipelotrichaceae bacterium]
MRKKVTIQDIADELGVSRNTVSKAINNSEGLAPATREKIIQKAMEMDYKQFSYVAALAGLSSSDTGIGQPAVEYKGEIALFTGQYLTQSHFASLMLDKFQRELSQLGYTMNTHRVYEENIRQMSLPITYVPERAKAIMCIEMFDYEYDKMLCELGVPILFVDGPCKKKGRSLPADQLYMENISPVMSFVEQMLERGYTKFGFIGNPYHCQSFFERYYAFRMAMHLNDRPIDPEYILDSNHSSDFKEKLLSLKTLPEVFICTNDFVAIDAINVLRENGFSVPEDVLFCGFDDSHESRHMMPPLTTIHIHTQIMAYEAIHLLMSRIKEPSLDYRCVHTESDLIYRVSTKD